MHPTPAPQPTTPGAEMFDGASFANYGSAVNHVGDYVFTNYPPSLGDEEPFIGVRRLSSIRVRDGCKATLFLSADFSGPSLELSADTPDLADFPESASPTGTWNNAAAALRLWCASGGCNAPGVSCGPCATCTSSGACVPKDQTHACVSGDGSPGVCSYGGICQVGSSGRAGQLQ